MSAVDARTLIASHLDADRRWVELSVWGDQDAARIEPFSDVEIRIGDLWA